MKGGNHLYVTLICLALLDRVHSIPFSNVISACVIHDFFSWVGGSNQSQLLRSSQGLLLANLVNNLPVLQSEDSGSREVNLLAGAGLVEFAHRKVIKGNTGVFASANPAANHIVPFSDQGELVSVERDIWECLQIIGMLDSVINSFLLFFSNCTSYLAKLEEHFLGCFFAPTGTMHWIVNDKLICTNFVHDIDNALAPVFLEVFLDNCLVLFLQSGHGVGFYKE